LHMAQLMPLPLTVSCFSKIQIGFTFLVPAHLGSPGKRAVKRVCVCVWHCSCNIWSRVLCNGTVSVRTSVPAWAEEQLWHSLVAGNWAAVTRGCSTALSIKCGQCRVYSQGIRLNTDLFISKMMCPRCCILFAGRWKASWLQSYCAVCWVSRTSKKFVSV